MFVHETEFRIRYAETDKMGYVYYGRYAEFFEVARVEALRSLGIDYNKIEEKGISMPVLNYSIEFKKPVFYDELIRVKTIIKNIPKTRINFEFETYNIKNDLVNLASVELLFFDIKEKTPTRAPHEIKNLIEKNL